jgi:hypothetical protein
MDTLLQIKGTDIEQLQPLQLSELLSILLYSEARDGGVAIHVPSSITVSDDGEDARWEGDVKPSQYIPNKFTIYQSKAEDLSPAECGDEILATDGSLIPAVAEVIQRSGAYVFFCKKPYVHKMIKRRIGAARKSIGATCSILPGFTFLHFLDGDKIASWTNTHPAAIAHVCNCRRILYLGKLKTWREWQGAIECQGKFHANKIISGYISSLRQHLQRPRSISRITGLSGLGKTRLAFEALALSLDDIAQASLSRSTVYLDMQHASGEAYGIVSAIASAGLRGVLVVDNCELSQHHELTKIVSHSDSTVSLLTMDYVPEASLVSGGTLSITIWPDDMEDIVYMILKDSPYVASFPDDKIRRIANFAKGFPQIATLMAEVGDTLNLDQLNSRGLVDKILWPRGRRDEKTAAILTALALFGHVGFDGDKKNQKNFVRKMLSGSPSLEDPDYNRLIKPFEKRRILQSAGKYRLIAPPPLAVALAADWWEYTDAERLESILPHIQVEGLLDSFCERVRQLHFSPNAQALAGHLLGATGPLSNADVLSSQPGSQLFRAFVELNPAAASDCLWRILEGLSVADLRKIEAGRRNWVWAVEKVCWEKDLFLQGAEIMLRMAAAENETWSNNATGQFKQLFQLYLAGTQMPALERLPVIEKGLGSGELDIRRVCIEALGVGLKTHHFSRSGGVEVRGSGLPEKDWAPRTNREITEYYERCFLLLKAVAMEGSPESAQAKTELGQHLRGILQPVLITKLEPHFRELATSFNGFWPEALEAIRSIFEFDHAEYPPESLARLNEWIVWLTPKSLSHRLALIVSQPPFQMEKDTTGHYVDLATQQAELLADELSQDPAVLYEHLPDLLQGDQRQAYAFGRRLSQKVQPPIGLIETCLSSVRAISIEKRNASLLAGLLAGVPDRDFVKTKLEEIAATDGLVDLLVPLSRMVKPSVADMRRVLELVTSGKIAPEQLRQFAYGSVLDHLPPDEILPLLQKLVISLPSSQASIFELVSMYIHRSDERWRVFRGFLRSLLITPGFSLGLAGQMDSHHWEQAAQKLLMEEHDEALARELTIQIIAGEKSSKLKFTNDTDRRAILATLFQHYPDISWPLIGAELLSENHYLIDSLLGKHGFDDNDSSIVWSLSPEFIVPWLDSNPKARSRLLGKMALFSSDDKGVYQWHPITLAIFKDGVDKKCISAVGCNLYSYGSSGSRVPYIDKRLRLLHDLENHPQLSVREMVRGLVKQFEAEKAREQTSDEEEAAGIY